MKNVMKFAGGFLLGFLGLFLILVVMAILDRLLGNTGMWAVVAASGFMALPWAIGVVRRLTGQTPVSRAKMLGIAGRR